MAALQIRFYAIIGFMTTLPQFSIDSLASRLAEVLPRYPVALAYLFGSAAKGQMTSFSDVDIALALDDSHAAIPNRLNFELEIEAEIAERCGLSQVDVRVINDAPLVLRGQVVTDGILLFARDEETRVDFETRTRSEYFDFLPAAEYVRQAFFDDVRERGLNGQRSEG
jgi:predicted nucleotidyltransferase